jgi:hypothetical protein
MFITTVRDHFPSPYWILTSMVSKVDLLTFHVIVSTTVSVVNFDVISAIKRTEKSIEKINVASKPLLVNRKIDNGPHVKPSMGTFILMSLKNETLKV